MDTSRRSFLQAAGAAAAVGGLSGAASGAEGKGVSRPLVDFFGGGVRKDITIYVASGVRGNKPEEELEHLKKLVSDSGAKALKFRLGGRMNRNIDSLPGRTEALIPMVQKAF